MIDLTTWGLIVTQPAPRSGRGCRSTRFTGYVDILLYAAGRRGADDDLLDAGELRAGESFYHFWLAERGDLFDPWCNAQGLNLSRCPCSPARAPTGRYANDTSAGPRAQGRAAAVTLYTRSGQIATNSVDAFDWPTSTARSLERPAGMHGGVIDDDPSRGRGSARSGITLTEILISIMIMGVGLVSLATLFPLGLLRLREAPAADAVGLPAPSRPGPTWRPGAC